MSVDTQLVFSFEPWEKQHFETDEAYERFQHWLLYSSKGLGDMRNLNETAKRFGVSVGMISRLSISYAWQYRADAYDRNIAKIAFAEREAAVKEMNERHARVARRMIEIVEKQLDTYEVDGVKAGDAVKLFDLATKIERLIHGQATENKNVTINDAIDFSRLSDEELDQLHELQQKARILAAGNE